MSFDKRNQRGGLFLHAERAHDLENKERRPDDTFKEAQHSV